MMISVTNDVHSSQHVMKGFDLGAFLRSNDNSEDDARDRAWMAKHEH